MSVGDDEFLEGLGSVQSRDFLVHRHLVLGLFALQLSTLQFRVSQRLQQQRSSLQCYCSREDYATGSRAEGSCY